MKDMEEAIYNFINTEPRTRKDIIYFAKNGDFSGKTTADKVIKGLLKSGKLTYTKVESQKLYSICNDPRLTLVAEKIALYDVRDRRINRLAEYWDKFDIREIVDDGDEFVGEIKSFTSGDWYAVTLNKKGECYCSCMGFHDVPCSHILAFSIRIDKVGWLP
jgi:hypothetical protein